MNMNPQPQVSMIINTDENIKAVATTTEPDIDFQRNTFRFKFDPEISDSMQEFARIHRLDSRVDFKDNFDKWFQKNTELISREETRIENMGYTDDIRVKLFRSIKYYYVKKPRSRMSGAGVIEAIEVIATTEATEATEVTEATEATVVNEATEATVVTEATASAPAPGSGKGRPDKYIQHQREFKLAVNEYILQTCKPTGKSPKDGYASFVTDCAAIIQDETTALVEKFNLSTENAGLKIKKTFKNQHFQNYKIK